jgi:general stress protein 26
VVAHPEDYEDVSVYTLDDDDEAELLATQRECTFMWATREGWPVGVIMSYVFHDGKFWLTCTSHRARVAAVRRDPRVSVCISSGGSGIRRARTVTYKGRCEIHDDDATKAWFYPALSAAIHPTDEKLQGYFTKFLDSPGRLIFEVTPSLRIGFDGAKMSKATAEWISASESGG